MCVHVCACVHTMLKTITVTFGFFRIYNQLNQFNTSTSNALPVMVKHDIYLFPLVTGDKFKSE